MVNRGLTAPANRLGRLLARGQTDAAIIEELYLAALSRYPRPAEARSAAAYVAHSGDRRGALEDVLWGLLNAKEFLLRH